MKPDNSHSCARQHPPVDWADVHRRLESTQAAIERIWAPGPAETKRILGERALALALRREPAESARESIEVVEFLLSGEKYAIESQYVHEVQALEHFTPLPCTPAFVLGIVNVRGAVLSVIDLRKFFELPDKGLSDLNRIIVLQSGRMMFGILADTIMGVGRVPIRNIQAHLPTLTGVRERYLRGVTHERLVILDGETLLTDENLVVQEHVTE